MALIQQNNVGRPDRCASREIAAPMPKVSRGEAADFKNRLLEGTLGRQISKFITQNDVKNWETGNNTNSEENRLLVNLHQKYERCGALRDEKIGLLRQRNENDGEIASDEREIAKAHYKIADVTKKLGAKRDFLQCVGGKIDFCEEKLERLFIEIDKTVAATYEIENMITDVAHVFSNINGGEMMSVACEDIRKLFKIAHMVENYRDDVTFGKARFIDNVTSVAKALEDVSGLRDGTLSAQVKENAMNMSTPDFLMRLYTQEEGRMIISSGLESTRKKDILKIKELEKTIKQKYTDTIKELADAEQLAIRKNRMMMQITAEMPLSSKDKVEIEIMQDAHHLLIAMISKCRQEILQARTHIGELINLEMTYNKALSDTNQTLGDIAELEDSQKKAQFVADELSKNRLSDLTNKRGEIADKIAEIDREVSMEEEMIADVSERLARIKKKKDDAAEKQLARKERKEWNDEYFRTYGAPAPREGHILLPKIEVKAQEEQKGRKIGEVLEVWAEFALLNFSEFLATHPQQRENLKNTIMRLGRIYLSEGKITYQPLIREFPTRIKVERVVDEDVRLYRIGIESKNEYRIYLNIGKMNNGNGEVDLQLQPLIMCAAIKDDGDAFMKKKGYRNFQNGKKERMLDLFPSLAQASAESQK